MTTSSAPISRRHFLSTCAVLAGGAPWCRGASVAANAAWAGEVGLTTSSLFRQMAGGGEADRRFGLLELPRVMRDELGMKVIDINTGTLNTRDPAQLDRFRQAVEDAGCVVSNLKVNLTTLGVKVQDLPIEHSDPAIRRKALEGYRDWIVAAKRIGARWVRPFPGNTRPELPILINSLEELVKVADGLGIGIVIENGGWIQADPDAIPRLIEALKGRIAAAPDTGSWEKSVRERGLARAFPHAVTCDFKVGRLGPAGEHPGYDLKRGFELGWKAGFRGPWCIEHGGADTKALFRELIWIRDELKKWMGEAK